jgi:hypothetical protein
MRTKNIFFYIVAALAYMIGTQHCEYVPEETSRVDTTVIDTGIIVTPIDTTETNFTDYSLSETDCRWSNIKYDNTIIVINSKEELKKYITCEVNDIPNIDFSKYTLLLASGKSYYYIDSFSKQISKQGDTCILNVTLEVSLITDMPATWFIALLTGKLDNTTTVELKVNDGKSYDLCTYLAKNLIHSITDFSTILLPKYPDGLFKDASFIVFAEILPWVDKEPTAYFIQRGKDTTIYNRICDFPQYAKNWTIPETGLPVNVSGNVYFSSYANGDFSESTIYTEMELTIIEKR